MKRFYLILLLILTTSTNAIQNASFEQLNQLDAKQQKYQQQQAENNAARFIPQSDIRSDTSSALLSFPIKESPCYPIRHITLVDYGNEDKPSQFLWVYEDAVKTLSLHLPHCLGGESLGVLMKQIQNRLIDKGFITTRVVAQEQDLHSGTLVLTVILGKVGNTLVEDRSPVARFTRLNAFTALVPQRGDLLNIRDIEQSLENLKRPPTADANIEIVPSETLGVSDLKISYAQSFPFRLNVGLDDSGSTSTGKWQGSGTLSIDNLFSANDLFYTSFTHSIKHHSDEKGLRASRSLAFYYAVPFGYWQLAFSHNKNRYHQEVFGAFNNYLYSGDSESTKATLSYLLYRDAVRKTTLSGSFWLRQSQNYIDGAEIEVQRRRMAGWEIGAEHKEFIGDSTLALNAFYKRGTGASGALRAPEELWNEGTSRPKILSASVQFLKPFMWGKQPWQFNTSWNAQWNKTPLIAQDHFSIGGRYTVRGFDGELSLSGESGWLWRNEISWNINSNNAHTPYLALDLGRVSSAPNDERLGHHLMGAAIGLRGNWKNISYDYFVGRPLRKPDGFSTSKTTTGFTLSCHF